MKYVLILFTLSFSLFAKDIGSALYSSCKFCHGVKAEVKYMNEIQTLNMMSVLELESKLISYKKGELDIYGYGPIMKMQMKNIPNEKISELASYIEKL
jgi:cytochrome c553